MSSARASADITRGREREASAYPHSGPRHRSESRRLESTHLPMASSTRRSSSYPVACEVRVFSRSTNTWTKGVVEEIFENDFVCVEYYVQGYRCRKTVHLQSQHLQVLSASTHMPDEVYGTPSQRSSGAGTLPNKDAAHCDSIDNRSNSAIGLSPHQKGVGPRADEPSKRSDKDNTRKSGKSNVPSANNIEENEGHPCPICRMDKSRTAATSRAKKHSSNTAKAPLQDPKALADFLEGADIHLIRSDSLIRWHAEGKRLPARRQEAEKDYPECFVPHSEMRSRIEALHETKFARDDVCPDVVRVASHPWESMQHPDPVGQQLRTLVEHGGGNPLPSFRHIMPKLQKGLMFFVDSTCLYQFKREPNSYQQKVFEKALANMHFLYAHDFTFVIRVESFKPYNGDDKQLNPVPVYSDPHNAVMPMSLDKLRQNPTPYHKRGWCNAEKAWSSTKQHWSFVGATFPATWAVGDACEESPIEDLVPVPPEVFEERCNAGQFEFTHNNDLGSVKALQRKVFEEKSESFEKLEFERLTSEQLSVLIRALPHFSNLERLQVIDTRIGDAEACELAHGLFFCRKLKELSLVLTQIGDAGACGLANGLQHCSKLEKLSLCANKIGDAGARGLAEGLQHWRKLEKLRLGDNQIGNAGARGLAEGLQHCHKLNELWLQGNDISGEAQSDVSQALHQRTVDIRF